MNDCLQNLIAKLRAAGADSPRLEAKMIQAHLLGCEESDSDLENRCLNEAQQRVADEIIEKRGRHWPLCKLLGQKGFYKYDFVVSEDVLSPRPDTEVLVEAAIDEAKAAKTETILDLGTGSGCIILSILGDVPGLRGYAVDASEKALLIAAENAERLKLDSRVKFFHGSWFDTDLPARLGTKFDMIVSNPPYIASSEIAGLEEEVKAHDPLSALDGGEDGLLHYRQIAALSAKIINPGGLILLEGGLNQENEITDIFVAAGFVLQRVVADLGGINRCIILKK